MAKKRLLIIEDDADVAEMLVVYFDGQGYEVIHALSGGEGIGLARARFPNLILLDVMLPDMDGFDVCRTLRTTTLTKYIPITFLTQRDGRSDKVAGLELGADDYVTKPFDIEELRLRIQGSMRRSSRETLQEAHTGLPTGALIEDMQRMVADESGWSRFDIYLRGLNDFRDKYSFIAADEALAFAAQTITAVANKHGTPEDFIGAFTEEHFIVFTKATALTVLTQTIANDFKEGVKKFYNFADNERGHMLVDESSIADDFQRELPLMHFEIVPDSTSNATEPAQPLLQDAQPVKPEDSKA